MALKSSGMLVPAGMLLKSIEEEPFGRGKSFFARRKPSRLGITEHLEIDGEARVKDMNSLCSHNVEQTFGLLVCYCEHNLNRLFGEFEKSCGMKLADVVDSFCAGNHRRATNAQPAHFEHEPFGYRLMAVPMILLGIESELTSLHDDLHGSHASEVRA